MEVMVDIETASLRNNASILILAGIKFNRKEDHKSLEQSNTFYRKITMSSCQQVGMDVNDNTMEWWNKQPVNVKYEVFSDNGRVDLKTALQDFSTWYLQRPCGTKIWSNGACFDIPILDDAYIRCGLNPPWKYWEVRDTRTIYDLGGMKSSDLPQNNLHHALHDCARQIWGVKECYKRIKHN